MLMVGGETFEQCTVKPLNSAPPPPNKGHPLNKGQMTTIQACYF